MRDEDEAGSARRLPAGPHGLSPELVSRNQRERLIAAIAEACAERGYAEISVTDVTKRAGVSTVTFYRQFSGKRECLLAAHEALLGRLLEEVDRTCEAGRPGTGGGEGERDREARLRAGIRTVLTLLAADPPSARLLSVEILAAGREGMERYDAAVVALASRLRPRVGAGEPPPHQADWTLVAGAFALIAKRVMAGEAARLPELEDELVATISRQA